MREVILREGCLLPGGSLDRVARTHEYVGRQHDVSARLRDASRFQGMGANSDELKVEIREQ